MCGWKLLPQFTAAQVVSSYHVSLSKGKREREGDMGAECGKAFSHWDNYKQRFPFSYFFLSRSDIIF